MSGRPRQDRASIVGNVIAVRLSDVELAALEKYVKTSNMELQRLGLAPVLTRASGLRSSFVAMAREKGILPPVEAADGSSSSAPRGNKNAWDDVRDGFLPGDKTKKPPVKSGRGKKSSRPYKNGSR